MEEMSLKIINKLVEKGYQAYIVGGYVRDKFLNKATIDVDIATNATPKQIQQIFSDAIISPFEYGSIKLERQNVDYEITTFRKEIKYENSRKPVEIRYINDLHEDLLRRDFTINTICMDKDGKIIDLLNGKEDIEKKIIRTIGDADKKIKEDSLRILRAVRFATSLNFTIDKSLKKAIMRNKKLLKKLSYNRKKDELTRIFMDENKNYGINLIKELGLKDVLELTNLDLINNTKDPIAIWAVIDKKDNYVMAKNEKTIVSEIRMMLTEKKFDNYTIYKYGSYVLGIICDLKNLDKKSLMDKYEHLPIKGPNNIAIKGSEIARALNRAPGEYLKVILNNLEYQIIMGNLSNEKEKMITYIKENY